MGFKVHTSDDLAGVPTDADRLGIRPRTVLAATTVAVVLPLLLLLSTVSGTFLYDDARLFLYNVGPPSHLARSFVELRDGFYRPVFEVAFGIEGLLFGANPVPYRLVNVLIHILATWLVYLIARRNAGRAPATLAALLFLGGATHLEAVIFISGLSSLLPALSCLAATLALWQAGCAQSRRTADRWCALALAVWLAGLLAKENGYTLPLAIAAFWCVESPGVKRLLSGWRGRFLVPALAIMVVFAPLRLLWGTGYALEITPAMLIKNAVYYAISDLVPLPDDYRYLSDTTAWQNAPWLGLLCLLAVVPGLIWIARNRRRLGWRPAFSWLAWSALLSLPSLPILAERENYLPTAGVALAIGALLAPVLRSERGAVPYRVSLGALALAALFLGNWLGMAERAYWWNEAARGSQVMVEQTLAAVRADDHKTFYTFYNVPHRAGFAHVQGPHYGWTLALLSGGQIENERVAERVVPEDGVYSAEQALADARRRFASLPGSPPVRVMVFQGYQLTLNTLLVP